MALFSVWINIKNLIRTTLLLPDQVLEISHAKSQRRKDFTKKIAMNHESFSYHIGHIEHIGAHRFIIQLFLVSLSTPAFRNGQVCNVESNNISSGRLVSLSRNFNTFPAGLRKNNLVKISSPRNFRSERMDNNVLS